MAISEDGDFDDDDFGGDDFDNDDDQVMGLVGDQSAYYPFMTSGSGPARQARDSIPSCA